VVVVVVAVAAMDYDVKTKINLQKIYQALKSAADTVLDGVNRGIGYIEVKIDEFMSVSEARLADLVEYFSDLIEKYLVRSTDKLKGLGKSQQKLPSITSFPSNEFANIIGSEVTIHNIDPQLMVFNPLLVVRELEIHSYDFSYNNKYDVVAFPIENLADGTISIMFLWRFFMLFARSLR
jgi:hypothetical protein